MRLALTETISVGSREEILSHHAGLMRSVSADVYGLGELFSAPYFALEREPSSYKPTEVPL